MLWGRARPAFLFDEYICNFTGAVWHQGIPTTHCLGGADPLQVLCVLKGLQTPLEYGFRV